jgi:hypothetical protein
MFPAGLKKRYLQEMVLEWIKSVSACCLLCVGAVWYTLRIEAGCAESGGTDRPAKCKRKRWKSSDGYFHPRLKEGGDRGRNCAGEKA